MRTFRLFLVASLTVLIAGAASAGPGCGFSKTASAADASASGCSQKGAWAKNVSAEQCALAKAKFASANLDCPYCAFTTELKKNAETVVVSTVPGKSGVTVVFAAVTSDDVSAAQSVAAKAYSMMNAPAHCAYTRAEMAKQSCDGCADGLGAFADAEITLENTKNGAMTVITSKNEKQVGELQVFFAKSFENAESE